MKFSLKWEILLPMLFGINLILYAPQLLWDPEISTSIIVPHMYVYECVNVGILLIFQLVVKSENEKEARSKKSVVELEVKYLGL